MESGIYQSQTWYIEDGAKQEEEAENPEDLVREIMKEVQYNRKMKDIRNKRNSEIPRQPFKQAFSTAKNFNPISPQTISSIGPFSTH